MNPTLRCLVTIGMSTGKLLATLALVGIATLAGCGSATASSSIGTAATHPASTGPAVPTAVAGTVEQVAARLGCTPEIRTEAEELREGVCATADGQFTVTTFPREDLKLTWLDAAAGWGGWYVVGPRWAVGVPTKELASTFRQKVGGSLVDGSKIPEPAGPRAT